MELHTPIMGYVLLPLFFLLVVFKRQYLIHAGIVFGGLNATSVLNVSVGQVALGLQPSLVCGLLAIASSMLPSGSRRSLQSADQSRLRLLFPLLAFAAYAVLSSVTLPVFFARSVVVPNPRVGYGSLVPLEYSATNINQIFYIVVLTWIAFLIAKQMSRGAKVVGSYVTALVVGICLVCSIALYQELASKSSLPFPQEVFHSNPSYNMMGLTVSDQWSFSGLLRLSGPFPEPSKLAHFLSAALFLLLFLPKSGYRKEMLGRTALAMTCVCLILCVSTTAFVCLAVGLCIKLATMMYRAFRGGRGRGLAMQMVVAVAAVASLVTALSWSLPERVKDEIVSEFIFGKLDTESGVTRLTVDKVCLDLGIQTGGLGVGWGSARGSTLPPTIFANVGVVGYCLLIWFVLRLQRARTVRELRGISSALGWSMVGFLVAHLLSVPDLTLYTEFAVLGMYVGVKACSGRGERVKKRRYPVVVGRVMAPVT